MRIKLRPNIMDFTLDTLKSLLRTLKDSGYTFRTVRDISGDRVMVSGRSLILRHDIDKYPQNALACAAMETTLGIAGTYYFRVIPGCFDRRIIQEISSMGHEIGYHYEDLDLAGRKSGMLTGLKRVSCNEYLAREAFNSFVNNLEKMRELAPVTTACMHGSPLSCLDSRLIWKYYDYRELGIICEPYFDINLDHYLYLTDTGRRWDGESVSVRDRVYSREEGYFSDWIRKPVKGSAMDAGADGTEMRKRYSYRATAEIIMAVRKDNFPEKALFTIHPQRWSMNFSQWVGELIGQKLKNAAKFFLTENQK